MQRWRVCIKEENKMTLKDIAKQLTTAVQTVPNLVQILRDGLEQASAGSSVEVTQVVSSGTKIASVKVDDETTDLYAPEADTNINYSTDEQIIGKWIDGTTDVYMKYFNISSYTSGTPVDLGLPKSYTIIDGSMTFTLANGAVVFGLYQIESYVNPQGNNTAIYVYSSTGDNYLMGSNIPSGKEPSNIFIKLIYIKPAA